MGTPTFSKFMHWVRSICFKQLLLMVLKICWLKFLPYDRVVPVYVPSPLPYFVKHKAVLKAGEEPDLSSDKIRQLWEFVLMYSAHKTNKAWRPSKTIWFLQQINFLCLFREGGVVQHVLLSLDLEIWLWFLSKPGLNTEKCQIIVNYYKWNVHCKIGSKLSIMCLSLLFKLDQVLGKKFCLSLLTNK